jgi:sugar transferase (PEP-CTERM system associated)
LWLRIILITLIIQFSLYYHDLYDFEHSRRIFDLSLRIVQAIGIACLFLALIYFLFPLFIIEQGIFFVGLFFLLLFLVSWRILYQYLCQKHVFDERIFLVGDGNLAHMIGDLVQNSIDSGYVVSAVFSNPGKSSLANELGVSHYSGYDHLCDLAQESGIGKIVVALEERRGKSPVNALLDCKTKGMQVFDGLSFFESLSGKIVATKTPPSWLIFSDGFRRHKLALWSKRAIDILLASLGLTLVGPLMLLIAGLVKWTSPGPAFFRQARVGPRDRPFQVIKFRTMREDAEAASGAVWAEEKDPRVTKVGRVLRKLRLDELPQFWNVLKGEMSFVGPRPERPEFVEQLKERLPYYSERHTVKPGITGWAQVNYGYGASEEDALRKLEYDLFYIKHLSLLFDLYIVLKTVKTVLGGNGAR